MSKEFIEGNFLIAKFMGYNYFSVKNEIWKLSQYDLHNYHEDWNKLIAAVKKLGDMEAIPGLSPLWDDFISFHVATFEIKSVWKKFIEILKWYNAKRLHNIKEKFNDIANGR